LIAALTALVASGRQPAKNDHMYDVFIGSLFTEVHPQDCGAHGFSSVSDPHKHGKQTKLEMMI